MNRLSVWAKGEKIASRGKRKGEEGSIINVDAIIFTEAIT